MTQSPALPPRREPRTTMNHIHSGNRNDPILLVSPTHGDHLYQHHHSEKPESSSSDCTFPTKKNEKTTINMAGSPPKSRETRAALQRGVRERGERPRRFKSTPMTSSTVETSLTGSASPVKRRPRKNAAPRGPVTITPDKPTTYPVPHYSHYSTEEINAIWFTQKEIDRTINECKETVQCMQDGIPLSDESEFTTRGLEYMTTSGFDITTSSLDAVKLVLEEQARQRKDDADELIPELLAEAMAGISTHRLRIAHLAGMKDARQVYGDGNFKTTAKGKPMRSRSLQRRQANPMMEGRPDLKPSNSVGNLRDRRVRRSSRGALGRQRRRERSDPSAEAVATVSQELSAKQRSLSDSHDPAVQAAVEQMRARQASGPQRNHSSISNTSASPRSTIAKTPESSP